jgi:hypothetical protein
MRRVNIRSLPRENQALGIVVNNAIIMVELANQIIADEKVDRTTAIIRAAPQRYRKRLERLRIYR